MHYCDFCKKSFSKESSLLAHACEKRRRWMMRDEKYVKLGFFSYQRFYHLTYSSRKNKEQTYEQFSNSSFFSAFVVFGKYLLSINAIDCEGFIDSLIKNQVKLANWIHPQFYEAWIRELGRKESSDRAVERNILLMRQWELDTGEPWSDFFRKVNPQLATKWIKSGRISPWLLYCGFGNDLFSRMSDEQLDLVKDLLDPEFWLKKINSNQDDVQQIKSILQEAGV